MASSMLDFIVNQFLIILISHIAFSVVDGLEEEVTNFDTETTQGFSLADYVTSFGYPIEVHRNIRTEDNYLLSLHRLPANSSDAPIVFLMHGLASSAECWVIMGPEKGLAFLLWNRGYDVWMGNARGSLHSRKHVTLDADRHSRYWDFDWDEIGYYDMPASLEYILDVTEQDDLIFIGHSQGGTALFVMLSAREEMNNVVKLGVGMSPAVFLGLRGVNINRNKASLIFQGWEVIRNILGIQELGPQLLTLFCSWPLFTEEICSTGIFATILAIGLDIPQLNRTNLRTVRKVFPIGASLRQYLHFGQSVLTGEFRQYDYGTLKNIQKYGSTQPPSYNLNKVTSPIALFRANADSLVFPSNVKRLAEALPNVVLEYLVPNILFNHLDFVIANDVVPLVYNTLFSLLDQYKE